MSSDVVDVIIPVHNQFDVVRECIESVLRSRTQNRIAVTVIDDASTDSSLIEFLDSTASVGHINLYRNVINLGFTRTVNLGMKLNPDRDVVLLNSDTVVYGSWVERLRAAAYSAAQIATVNPLTSSSHISAYPDRNGVNEHSLDVDDEYLDTLASLWNAARQVVVHTTVGFCMYIKRAVIEEIGYFDALNFPVGYGEECDFCYRARDLGWSHIITGDTYVRHRDGRSFGERKLALTRAMLSRFEALHPEFHLLNYRFRELDPVRPLRSQLDLARLGQMVAGSNLPVLVRQSAEWGDCLEHATPCCLLFDAQNGKAKFLLSSSVPFPNLPFYRLPDDLPRFNRDFRNLGIRGFEFASANERKAMMAAVEGRFDETALEFPLYLASGCEATEVHSCPNAVQRVV